MVNLECYITRVAVTEFMEVIKCEDCLSVHNGMRYWRWVMGDRLLSFNQLHVKDFVVLLPNGTHFDGEYTKVTKEWSPAMLEHYEYPSVGMERVTERKPIMRYDSSTGRFDVLGWEETIVGEGASNSIIV